MTTATPSAAESSLAAATASVGAASGNGGRSHHKARVFREWLARLGEDDAFDEFLEYIYAGGNMTQFVTERGMSVRAMGNWLDDPIRKSAYARAREERAHVLVDDMIAVTRRDCSMPILDSEGRLVGTRVDPGKVQQAKLEADKLQWVASKSLYAVYGDKLEVNANMNVTQASPEDLIKRIAGLEPSLAVAASRALGLNLPSLLDQSVTDVEGRHARG